MSGKGIARTLSGRYVGGKPAPGRWAKQAACVGADLDLFFPVKVTDEDAAKQVCKPCPVRAECLQHALKVREAFGVWGGLTSPERDALLRRDGRRGLPFEMDGGQRRRAAA